MSDPERVVVRLRSHGRALLLPAVLLCGIAFGTTFALGRVAWQLWDLVVWSLAIVLAVVLCVVPTLAWLSRRVVVTSRRVIVRSAFGGSKRDVPLSRIHDVTLRRQGLQAIVGSGDVLLSTGGEHPVTLADVPSASLVQRTLTELVAGTPGAPALLDVPGVGSAPRLEDHA
ncbi:PH domain-containing protein [Agrococcus sp. SGAir0287]|uniref:PH domain-containing protein n=1 Tax=Agrococcus sp. SGAir0287 TaxID=2070347 RepID=UPI0010CD64EB|nr:PH domain-containing protein [Agrococcus sp. SGAir0287]QCR18654.1 hypothetical protein C1N71_03640 [Agrococcus sp. SGAir0287]